MATNNNRARQIADIILDAVAAFWNGGDGYGSVDLLSHLPMTGTVGADGNVTVDATDYSMGAILAGVALSQTELPHGDTPAEHIAAARQYLDGLAPYEA